MIFDLEIPSSNIELVYIPEGNAIPTGVSPLYYLTLDHKNKIPSDFITLERKDLIQDYAALGVDEISTQTFIPRGSKFNITNISKIIDNQVINGVLIGNASLIFDKFFAILKKVF